MKGVRGKGVEECPNGPIQCGFAITGRMECQREDAAGLYVMARAVTPFAGTPKGGGEK